MRPGGREGSGSGAFVAYLNGARPLIEGYLESHGARSLLSGHGGAPRDDLGRYLYEPLDEFTLAGGKRIRPALALLGAEAVGANPTCALSVASAIELFQSAALIHDDIADGGGLRRGRPCLHLSEGVGLAINMGDAALVCTYSLVLRDERLDGPTRLLLLDELVSMMGHTLEGQALDLGFVRDERLDISQEDYLLMARSKTAYYSAATPLAAGALAAGGDTEQVEALRHFGMDVGLAFQLQDDLLNLVGDAEAQGKDFRSDITEGKRTLMVVHALGHLPTEKSHELRAILQNHCTRPEELARAVELMNESGSLSHARLEAQSLVLGAKSELEGAKIGQSARETLFSMADFFIGRQG